MFFFANNDTVFLELLAVFFFKEQRPHQMKGKCSSHPLSTWCDHTNCKSLYCICVSFKFYAVLMKCHVIFSKIDFLNVISIPVYLRGLPLAFFFSIADFNKIFLLELRRKKRFDLMFQLNVQIFKHL